MSTVLCVAKGTFPGGPLRSLKEKLLTARTASASCQLLRLGHLLPVEGGAVDSLEAKKLLKELYLAPKELKARVADTKMKVVTAYAISDAFTDGFDKVLEKCEAAGIKGPLLTAQEYVESGLCPFCLEELDTEGQCVDIDVKSAQQEVSCLNCSNSWTDHYQLIGYMPDGNPDLAWINSKFDCDPELCTDNDPKDTSQYD